MKRTPMKKFKKKKDPTKMKMIKRNKAYVGDFPSAGPSSISTD